MQHHLLQHFRQNFWHLVDNLEKVKREAVEQQQQQSQQQQPPSVAEADYLRPGSGVGGYSATSDTFGAQFGADESSIRAASSHQHDRSVEYNSAGRKCFGAGLTKYFAAGRWSPSRATPARGRCCPSG